MKKLALTTIAAISIASGAFAQGFVAWSATPGPSVIGYTNSILTSTFTTGGGGASGLSQGAATGNTVAGGSSLFYYALMVNTTGTATTTPTTLAGLSGWTYTGLAMTNGTTANGRLSPTVAATGAVPSTGANENFMLVGWSANLVGSTNVSTVLFDLNNWGTVQSGITGTAFFGVSAVATLTPSTSSSSPTAVFGTGLINNPSAAPMVLYSLLAPTPEPGTMALAALGGASLLLFRRRK